MVNGSHTTCSQPLAHDWFRDKAGLISANEMWGEPSWGFYEGIYSVSPERQPHKDGLLESKVAQLPSRCCMFPETNPVTNLVFKKQKHVLLEVQGQKSEIKALPVLGGSRGASLTPPASGGSRHSLAGACIIQPLPLSSPGLLLCACVPFCLSTCAC